MLDITVAQQNGFLVSKPMLQGKIYKEEEVAKYGGGHHKVSTKAKTSGRTLSQNGIIFWEHKCAGQVCFFAENNQRVMVILTLLAEQPSHIPGTRSFFLTEEKEALVLDEIPHLQSPSWWYVHAPEVVLALKKQQER